MNKKYLPQITKDLYRTINIDNVVTPFDVTRAVRIWNFNITKKLSNIWKAQNIPNLKS